MTKKFHKYSSKKLEQGEPPNFSGQHFMHNKKLLNEIVDRANISIKDTVLDLGAGKGALTTVLNQKAGKVLAIEYDANLVAILKEKTSQADNIEVIHQDIMRMHLPEEEFVVVSNIPYAITTPIMKLLLSNPSNRFQRGIIVMENGAAKRFTSSTVKDAYVLAWRMWFDISYVKCIARGNFSPPPKVDSAMISIKRKKEALLLNKDYNHFLGLAEYALQRPQDPAKIALRGIFTPPQLKYLMRNLNMHDDSSIGVLDEKQWLIIYHTMVQHVSRHYWPKLKKKYCK